MSRHSGGGGRMGGVRQWLNDHSAVVTIVAMVVLISAVLFMIDWDDGPDYGPPHLLAYFYNTVTEEIFVDTPDNIPPFLNEAGHECVVVRMFTCGSCAESERWPGFYEKFTDEYKRQAEDIMKQTGRQYLPMGNEPGQPGMLISLDGQNWVTPMDPSVRDRYKEMMEKCPDGKYRPCNPGDEDKKE